MKPLVKVVLMLFCLQRAGAQTTTTDITVGKTYEFTVPVVVTQYDYIHQRVARTAGGDTTFYVARAGFWYTVVDVARGGYVIQFPTFAGSYEDATQLNNNLVSKQRPQQQQLQQEQQDPSATDRIKLFFFVPAAGLDQKSIRHYAKTRWNEPDITSGTVIIPVKIRPHPFDFNRDFALGLTIGPRWQITSYRDYHVNWLFAFNANIVTIDSASTEGRIKKATDKGALGAATGVVFDFNGPQVGVFMGIDWLSNRDKIATNWQYQGQPWFSVGLGYTIFTRGASSTTSQPTEQKK